MIDSIDTFKPSANEPDQSRVWRIFDSLFCCYVQQLKQQIVADQLSISPRQLRREQRMALEALADFLWNQYNLDAAIATEQPQSDVGVGQFENPELAKELGWVQDLQPANPTSLNDVLTSVLGVTEPICKDKNVSIDNQMSAFLPPLAIHDVVLTQILVNLISAAINRTPEGRITISAERSEWVVDLSVKTPQTGPTPSLAKGANISLATELSKLSSIELNFTESETVAFCANLLLPIREQIPVLLVDDNEDALALFHRYTAGSRYQLISTQDPNDILELVEQAKPKMIILDIMMPETNGWMILGMLKNHPL
ncbi:MAG: hybrid sensor histidine kinase/response regulator, partial [Hyphomicrobiales bacterium]|nr:hybrid sensor histidine kinase/response regulator [Hyphomicrobiales bacterium]